MQPAVTILPAAIALLLFASQLTAQEAQSDEPADAAPEAIPATIDGSAEDSADDEEDSTPVVDLDDPAYADLDEQTYDQDDDDFVPTEEIPADEAIPFPTDI